MEEVYVLSAKRTPIGKFGGELSSFSATQLGGHAISEAVKNAGLKNSEIDQDIRVKIKELLQKRDEVSN